MTMMTIYTDKIGMDKVFEIVSGLSNNKSYSDEQFLDNVRSACEICPMAGYYAALKKGLSRDQIASILAETCESYVCSLPNEAIDPRIGYDRPIVEELFISLMAYILCMDESPRLIDSVYRIWDNGNLYINNRKASIYKLEKFISVLIQIEDNLPKIGKKANELLLYTCFFLYKHKRGDWDRNSNDLEFCSIHGNQIYRLDDMSDEGKIIAGEYFKLLTDNEDQDTLASFIRKIDREFTDYEAVFGKSRAEFLAIALNTGKSTSVLPFRILRNYYHDYSTHEDWIKYVNENVKDSHVLDFCNFYHACETISNRALPETETDENSYFQLFESEMNKGYGQEFNEYNGFEVKKIKYAQGKLFINVLNKGYDIRRVIELLGDRNIFTFRNDYKADWKMFDDELDRRNKECAIKAFYDTYSEPEDMVFIYMNSFLHEVADIRKFIETVCNCLSKQGFKPKKVSNKVKELFAGYTFSGQVRAIDERGNFKGLYTIEPYNVFQDSQNKWKSIHHSKSALTGDEKTEKCRLLFKSDMESGKDGYWRFTNVDSKLYFAITGIERIRNTYNNCIIYVGNLWPYTDPRTGEKTAINMVDKSARMKALDDALEWFETLKKWDFAPKRKYPVSPYYQLFIEPSTVGRGSEFAIAVLDLMVHFMEDEEAFKIVFEILNRDFVDRLNEYKYKPGMLNGNVYNITFNKDESYHIIGKATEVLKSGISTKRKMQIYMFSCLKCVYFLDRFIWQLPKEDRPFLFSDTDEHMYYLFPVEFMEEFDDSLRFAFRCGYASRYKDKLYIDKSELNADTIEKYKTDPNLFAEIYYFNEKQKRGQLYQLFTKAEIKNDKGQNLRDALDGLKVAEDQATVSKRIKEIIASVPEPADAMVFSDAYIGRFIRSFFSTFKARNFDAVFILGFFVCWNTNIGKDYIPDEEMLNQRTIGNIKKLLYSIIENNEENHIDNILAIYKHSYCKYGCSEQELFDELTRRFAVKYDKLESQYRDDTVYEFLKIAYMQ